MPKHRKKRRPPKRSLALPDLEQTKSAVLNSLTSKSGQRTYHHAINEFVALPCTSALWRDQKRNESAELRNNSHSFRCYPSRLFRVRFDRQYFSYSNYPSAGLDIKSDSHTLVRQV